MLTYYVDIQTMAFVSMKIDRYSLIEQSVESTLEQSLCSEIL